MSNEIKISPSQEDYLERILFIRKKNGTVRVTDLATEMNISKPSVNKAINNLKAQGLVDHERYGLLSLTTKGEQLAREVEKRHLVLKKFLYEVLNVEEDKAEKEACLIEHSISLDTIEKLSDYLDINLKNKAKK